MADYGVFSGLVDDVGAIVAATGAIIVAFKGTGKWEPCEDDVPNGPRKVAGFLTLIVITLFYLGALENYNGAEYAFYLKLCGGAAFIGLLIYSTLITVFVFDEVIATGPASTREQKIIGGLWMRADAKAEMAKDDGPKTVQELFAGRAYDVDLVWPRMARALSKNLFILSYFLLLVGGGSGVAIAAIMLNQQT